MKKPSVEQVHEYMIEKGLNNYEEAENFIDHYEMVGWVVGKARTPMKKWKSAVNVWVRNAKKWGREDEKSKRSYQSFSDRQRQQADEARAEIDAFERGVYPNNVRSIRSVR